MNSKVKILRWLPIFILLIISSFHFILVYTQNLSPWLGGGFGMFASTDVGSARRLIVTAVSDNGEEHPVELVGNLVELKQRARGLPNDRQLDTLARATWRELAQETISDNEQQLTALRIEVWKTRFDVGTLRPKQQQITQKTYVFVKKKE